MILAIILASTLSLQQAWETAALKNPSILESREYSREMDYLIEEARSQVYPQVELVSTYTGNLNPGFLNSKDFEDILAEFPFEFRPQANYLYDVSLSVDQDLYTGGTIRTGLEAARLAKRVAQNKLFSVTNRVYRDVAENYTMLYLAGESHGVYELNIEQQDLFLKQVQLHYDVGDATQLELLKARVALASVRPELLEVEERMVESEGRLKELLGEGAIQGMTPGELPSIEIQPGIEDLIPYAMENHPDVLELLYGIEESILREKLVIAEGKPQASLHGGYGYNVAETTNLGDPLYKAWNLELRLSLSLFDGFNRKYRQLEQNSRKEQLAYRLQATRTRITTTLETLIKKLTSIEEQLKANRQYYEESGEAHRIAEENFKLGAVTQLEVLDAQREERQAHLDYIRSRFYAFMNRVNLLYEAGVPLYKDGLNE